MAKHTEEQMDMADEVVSLLNTKGLAIGAKMHVLQMLGTDAARLPDALAAAREYVKGLPS